MIECPTPLCSGNIIPVENWRQGQHCEFAAAECRQCDALYWIIKRNNKLAYKLRLLADFDQRKEDRR